MDNNSNIPENSKITESGKCIFFSLFSDLISFCKVNFCKDEFWNIIFKYLALIFPWICFWG